MTDSLPQVACVLVLLMLIRVPLPVCLLAAGLAAFPMSPPGALAFRAVSFSSGWVCLGVLFLFCLRGMLAANEVARRLAIIPRRLMGRNPEADAPYFPPLALLLVLSAVVHNVSIAGLLMSGLRPALLLGAIVWISGVRLNKPPGAPNGNSLLVLTALSALDWTLLVALLALFLHGLRMGLVTPTESAAGVFLVAAAYLALAGLLTRTSGPMGGVVDGIRKAAMALMTLGALGLLVPLVLPFGQALALLHVDMEPSLYHALVFLAATAASLVVDSVLVIGVLGVLAMPSAHGEQTSFLLILALGALMGCWLAPARHILGDRRYEAAPTVLGNIRAHRIPLAAYLVVVGLCVFAPELMLGGWDF